MIKEDLKKLNKELMKINSDTFKLEDLNKYEYFKSEEWKNLWASKKPKTNMEFLILARVMALGKAYFDLND